MKVVGIIPVRLESNRLPEKALKDICGLPMTIHVLKRSQMAKKLDEVYVATESKQIFDLVEKYGGKAIMTSSKHKTGSDRIAEAAKKIDCDVVVNIQGDEALVMPEHIDAGVDGLLSSDANVSILLIKFYKKNSPSDIKAVTNNKTEILYFSRSDLPSNSRTDVKQMLKAYHVVSFKKDFLLKYSNMDQTPLEKIEYNEYLRILENGYKIQGVLVDSDAVSVDTESDLEFVRNRMNKDPLFPLYK